MAEKKAKRERGRILTEAGWNRLDVALQAWEILPGNKRTQERIALEAKMDDGTIAKILGRREKADLSKLEQLFRAFGLSLEESDHCPFPQTTADLNFVGREGAIADLTTLINRGEKVIVIQARGGVGKTTLARKYLQQKFDAFLEFPIAKETKDIASIESLIEEKLRQLGEEPGREFLVSIDRLKRRLQAEQIGILIDNLEPALDSAGKFIEPHRRYVELLRVLADPSVQSVTLITSRERLHEPSVAVQHYPLRSLEVAAWEKFFQLRQLATTPALTALHHAYGGNAKAMEILSSVIKQDYAENIEAYWQENQNDLLIERDLEDLVTQQFDRLQQVDPDAYKLLCRMGCYRYQDVPTVPIEGLFCLLWDVPENRQSRVVKALKERSLVEFEDKEFWLHPVIRSEAIGRLRECEEWKTTNQNVAEFWTNIIKTVKSIEDAQKAFEAYHHYCEINSFEDAGNVILTKRFEQHEMEDYKPHLGSIFYRLGMSQQMIPAINRIIGEIKPGYALSRLYNLLGDQHWAIGEINESIRFHIKSQKIATECLNSAFTGTDQDIKEESKRLKKLERLALYNISLCRVDLWELHEARHLLEEYILFNDDLTINTFAAPSCLAFLNSQLGYPQETLEKIHQTLDHYAARDNSGWLTTVGSLFLGLSYKNLRDNQKALDVLMKTIILSEKNQFNQLKARALNGLSEVLRDQKDLDKAIKIHHAAVDLAEKIGAKCELGEACYQLGLTYQIMNEADVTCKVFQKAIRIFTEMEAPKQVERVKRSMESSTED